MGLLSSHPNLSSGFDSLELWHTVHFSTSFSIENSSFQHLLKPFTIAFFNRSSSSVTQGRTLCMRRGRWKWRKEGNTTCSSFLSHLVMKTSNKFLLQSVFFFKFQTLFALKKKE